MRVNPRCVLEACGFHWRSLYESVKHASDKSTDDRVNREDDEGSEASCEMNQSGGSGGGGDGPRDFNILLIGDQDEIE